MKEESIYENLRIALQTAINNGDTQNGIAKATEVKQATVWRFIKGLTALSGNNLIRLLDYVGADIVFDAVPAGCSEIAAENKALRDEVADLKSQVEQLKEEKARLEGKNAAQKEILESFMPSPRRDEGCA